MGQLVHLSYVANVPQNVTSHLDLHTFLAVGHAHYFSPSYNSTGQLLILVTNSPFGPDLFFLCVHNLTWYISGLLETKFLCTVHVSDRIGTKSKSV
jgi:hypothetical protein